MSRSSARIASKQPVKTEVDDEGISMPRLASEPKRPGPRTSEGMTASTSRRTIITTSESSAEELMDEDEEILSTPRKKLLSPSKSFKAPFRDAASDDVFFARSKLDALLAHISQGEQGEIDDFYDSDGELSPPSKSQRRPRPKKSRKSGGEDGQSKAPALVLKLFDRAVDLAKFCKSSRGEVPLYPVCREWIRNQQGGSTGILVEGEEGIQNEKGIGFLHRLPEPLPIAHAYIENELSPRIPLSIVKPTIRKEDVDDAMNGNMTAEELMNENMKRWKGTREEWREAGKRNDSRYKHSCDVLRSMYEKSTLAEPLIEPKLEPLDN